MITQKHQIELRHYRYFTILAEELNFRKAAEKLHIAQPGLSRQIKQMEDVLGVELFDRNKRNVKLTPAGHYLLKEVRFITNHIQQTHDQISRIGHGIRGELRIGYVGSAMQTVLPSLLSTLHKDHPDVTSSLEELNNQNQINMLINDQLDLGFVRMQSVPEKLKMLKLHEDSFSIVLPKDHPLDKSSFTGVDQLAKASFILFSSDYSPQYYEKIISICEDKGFHPKIAYKSVHAYTIFKLVESGLGVAIVPTSLKHGYDLDVKFLEIPNISQQTTLSAVWSERNRNPVLSTVLELLI